MAQVERGSVTEWLSKLRDGDNDVAYRFWSRYYAPVAQFAKRRIGGRFRRVADEEDVAASVMRSVFEGLACGRFPLLVDRDELWKLLVVIAKQKSASLVRKESTQKRGNGMVCDEQSLAVGDTPRSQLANVPSRSVTPDMIVVMEEEFARLTGLLGNELHRKAAIMRIQGYSNGEIATFFDRTERTVERWIEIVRREWELEMQNGGE